jgi:16S rRNA (guanine527-N7)-methyltransferase
MIGMKADTIARLLHPYADLPPELLEKTSDYIDLLLKWNARMNLTAVRQPQEIITRHFGESFFAASQLLSPATNETVIDVGSGPGFPGLPLAMFAPGAQVTLIESNARKVAFLNEVISALTLKNARAVRARAEAYSAQARLVTMRAVETFERSLLAARGLVGEGGRLALMIGAAQVPLAKKQAGEISWHDQMLIPGSRSRVLLTGTKAATVGIR